MRHHILFWIKHPWVRYPKKNSRPGMFLNISWVWHMSELIFIIDVESMSVSLVVLNHVGLNLRTKLRASGIPD